jgi:AcrR family transcriptional regulator
MAYRMKNPELHKEKLLEALEKSLGIVTPACREVGVSRETFYRYYREDEEFKKAVDDINEVTLDFAENQLLKKIKEGSERSILFYMKYKARKRGYTDSLDITSDGKSITEIKLIHIKNKEDLNEDDLRD